jgi:uncharacterized protein YjbJ (UPF0337 family)
MADGELDGEVPTESPATWENLVVGKVTEGAGHVFRDDELVEEGKDRAEIAHEVREEFDEDQEEDEA